MYMSATPLQQALSFLMTMVTIMMILTLILGTNSSELGINRTHQYFSTPSRRRTCRDVIADSSDTCWTPAARAGVMDCQLPSVMAD